MSFNLHLTVDMCLVLASHTGYGWEGWHRGTMPCVSFSVW